MQRDLNYATVVLLEDVPKGAFASGPYGANIDAIERQKLALEELWNDIDRRRLENAGIGTILQIIVKHIVALNHFGRVAADMFKD